MSLEAAADLAIVDEAASFPGAAADLAPVDAAALCPVDVVVLMPADVEGGAREAAGARSPKDRNERLRIMRTCLCPLRN